MQTGQRAELLHKIAELELSMREQDAALADFQQSMKFHGDFLLLLAHELRGPLSALFIESQTRSLLLEKSGNTAFTEDRLRNMIARDERQINSMLRLVDDMVEYTQLQNETLAIQPAQTELSSLLSRVVTSVSGKAKVDMEAEAGPAASKITLHANERIEGLWDAFRVEQIVTNLLTNALQSGEGKAIELVLTATATQIEITIHQFGNSSVSSAQGGIDLFEAAATGKSRLALHIAKQLAVAMAGSLTVTVAGGPGNATIFTLTLPR